MSDPTLKRPFDFVPIPYGEGIDRHAPAGHDVFTGHSGRLTCRLETLSPTLVMDSKKRAGTSTGQSGTFMTNQDLNYIIPGTSLKGMIRSVFEAIIPCCTPLTQKRHVDKPFHPCTDRNRLCPACRTFGFLNHGSVHQGQVNIGQAHARTGAQPMGEVQLIPMFGPNPSSTHYQESVPNGRRAKGRKFYFHQSEIKTASTENDRNRGPHVKPLQAGAVFEFTVTYQNLSDTELDALVAALVLTDNGSHGAVRHKLGYGKPAGLGSVQIEITEAHVEPSPEERYQQFHATRTTYAGDNLAAWVEDKQAAFFNTPSTPVKALMDILRYPPDESAHYTYYPNGKEF